MDFANRLMELLEVELSSRGDTVLTTGGLLTRIRRALDLEASSTSNRAPVPPQLPQPPAEFPKLKVRYDRLTGRPLEHVICETVYDEIPYMSGWLTRPLAELDEVRRQIECAA